ncbi:MAG: MerR family transcriptional regulator [Myxococcales bacterium]|nr:MerR family transcriptional regulator [Myxococcales bacterium]
MASVRFLGGAGGPPAARGGGGLQRGPQSPGSQHSPLATPSPRREPTPERALREERHTGPERRQREREDRELPPIPDKLYFRIGEVAHLVGVEPHVLRYWEAEFRSVRPQKSQRGQRVYSRRDVDHLRKIRELLYEQGFTIAGAKKAMRGRGLEPREADDPAVVMSHRAREALVEIRHDVESFLRELGG